MSWAVHYLNCLLLQIYSSRDLEEQINKIREILSDDKHDWEQRITAVRSPHPITLQDGGLGGGGVVPGL